MAIRKLKGIDGKLDKAWSEAVKVKAGYRCEYCKKDTTLNSHHVYSRSNRSVRWDLDNGYCLCVAHHTFGNFSAHRAPLDFAEWMEKDRGVEWLDNLRLKANSTKKWTKAEKEELLIFLQNYIESFG